MLGKKGEVMATPNSAPGDVKAILGKGSEFEGKLRFEGTVRIDGKFKGEVHSEGTLIVGEAATLDGDVDVSSAIISGELRGNVKAKTRVELHAPAKLFGNVETPVLVIQEGVMFDGHCQMSKEGQKPAEKSRSVWGAEQAIPADKSKNASEKKPA
jgi:cytoskeletal protein CcmA (bactofilin family)